MMIPIPAFATAKYTLKGIWLALVGLVLVVIVGFAVVQTVRLEGFKFWPFETEGALAKIDRLELEIKALIDGQEDAREAQQAVNDAAEKIYTEVAEKIDVEHDHAQDEARSAADRYIADNRLRCPADRGASGRTAPAAPGNGAGVPQSVPAPALVAVSDADVRACTAAATYALKAHEWATALEATNPAD
jgi:hypothetical protein